MDKATFLKKIKEIGTCEDDAQRRTLLAEINDEVSNVFDENETLKTEKEDLSTINEQYKNDCETLRQANMKLFLRVGNDKTEQQQNEDSTGIKTPEVSNKSFEDLFNEKGGLK